MVLSRGNATALARVTFAPPPQAPPADFPQGLVGEFSYYNPEIATIGGEKTACFGRISDTIEGQ